MIFTAEIELKTKGFCDILDITHNVETVIENTSTSEGLVTVSVPGATAGITTIEYEPGLINDLKRALEKLAPQNMEYDHDRAWGDGNGFSHVRAAIIGASKSFPYKEKRLLTGTWQQIVLIDFDNRPRRRNVIIQVIGE